MNNHGEPAEVLVVVTATIQSAVVTQTAVAIDTQVAQAVQATLAVQQVAVVPTATVLPTASATAPACCNVPVHLSVGGVELVDAELKGGYILQYAGCKPHNAARPDVLGDWRGAPFRVPMDSACVNIIFVDVPGYTRSDQLWVEYPTSGSEAIIPLTPVTLGP